MKVLLKGKCEYAQVLPGQERGPHPDSVKQGKADPTDRHYAITVECDRAQFKQLKKVGLNAMHQLKEKDDDSTWITIKSTKKKTTSKGSWDFENPEVVSADGTAWDSKVNIGNGSVVLVEASLEQAGAAKALRLKKVQVLVHVPYEGKSNDDDGEVLDLTDGETKTEVKSDVPDDIF